MRTSPSPRGLPRSLRRFFWDVPADRVAWPARRDFIIGRLLRVGDRTAVQWLLKQLGEPELADWLRAHHGGRLPPERLRYWQLMLRLPAGEVDRWVAAARQESWGTRVPR